jgi:putative alpha-1,2-mannosidase
VSGEEQDVKTEQKMMVKTAVGFLCAFCALHASARQAANLAPLAAVDGPGQYVEAAVDGIRQQSGSGEWIGESPNTWYGWITYPKLELKWQTPQTINKVVLYDRPTRDEHMAACVLKFSDGSEEHVFAVPNDGSPKTVVFKPREVTGLTVEVVDGVGTQIGLSEIEVYFDPDARPESRKKKTLTDYVSYVDPMIETGRGRWFFCTPGSRPFGMVCASAYTRNKNQGGGGYNYNSTEILGFANIHAWIMSGINIMPTTGDVDANGGEKEWKSGFSHETEIMEPGYHKLYLDRYHTQVEYTSTDRVAFYRLKYSKAEQARLLLQLGGFVGAASYVDGRAKWVSPTRIEGSHGMTDRLWGGPKLSHVFFVMEFDRPLKQMDGWKGGAEKLGNIKEFHNPIPEGRIQPGYFKKVEKYLFKNLPEEQAGVALCYDVDANDEVLVKIGISYTSIENARKNLEGECPHWDFDRVRTASRSVWNEWLGKIDVKGGEEQTRIKFYTDLWHVLLGRHRINDLNGDYPSYMSGKNPFVSMQAARGHPGYKVPEGEALETGVVPLVVERVPVDAEGNPKFNMYNSDATWLTMWNLNILWGLGWPEVMDDFSASMLQYAKVGGYLPRGPSGGGYTAIMRGCPTTSLITATWQKGLLRKANEQEAYEAMKKSHALMIRDAGAGEMVQGAFEYWALAQMARELGHEEDLPIYKPWIDGWKKYFDPEKNLLSGKWVEANDWQGTFGVSHDITGLAELMGGPDVLAEKLNDAFEQGRASDFVYTYSDGTVSYANQPGLSNAHVFNQVGHPWLSQYWVRRVSRQAYGGTNPNIGYGGHDEDQGQMGGVSALMKIGLFSLRGTCSQEPVYEITAPEFDELIIQLDPRYYSGRTFTIRTHNNAVENCYIQKAELNGKPLERCWFYHTDFAKGGLLELWLGPEPNKNR